MKALRRKERDLVLQTSRHEIRTLNGNREVLMIQTKELVESDASVRRRKRTSSTDEAESENSKPLRKYYHHHS